MLQSIGSKLSLIGFFLIFVGVILLIAAALVQARDSNTSAGIIIFIGPVPIIIGAGPHALFAILLAAALTVSCLFLFFLLRRKAG